MLRVGTFGLLWLIAASASAAEPQRWALLVGVNDYVSFTDLRFCGNDAAALAASLKETGFDERRVALLHDAATDVAFRPSKNNVERQLDLLLNLAGPDDLVIVSFSGHGIHIDGKSYRCPNDADDARPDATMIAVDDVYQKFGACRAALKLLVVDACRNDPRPPGKKSATPDADRRSLGATFDRPPDGIVVLASCAPGQVSWEDEELKHGVFMSYVLKGLSGEADGNRNGRVTLGELYDYAAGETKLYVAKRYRDLQVPAQRGEINGVFELPRSGPPMAVAPFDAAAARRLQAAWAAHLKKDALVTNSIGMKLTLIPPGEFVMGSPETEQGRDDDETQHRVRITKPFYLGVYEVTQSEYELVMGENPSWFSTSGDGKNDIAGLDTGRCPVEMVSWEDATEFCRRLGVREGATYRLPTEAEWEFACRAGTTTAFSGGTDLTRHEANFGRYADPPIADALGRTTSVGKNAPNGFGLFDVHGNVWEWCADFSGTYDGAVLADPTGPTLGKYRIFRGASWAGARDHCRSASRGSNMPNNRGNTAGLRVALVP